MCALLQLHKRQVTAPMSSAWEVSSIWRGGGSFSFQEPVGKGGGGEEKGDKGGQEGERAHIREGWGQEEKGMTEDEMAGWHHRLDGREFD